MKTLIFVMAVAAALLTGCATDPLGATTRANSHNQAWITTNQADANAKIAQANAAKYALNTQQLMLLQDYADRTGKTLVMRSGQYYLTDGQTTIRAILKT